MNETLNDSDKDVKGFNWTRTLRYLHMILIPFFVFLILLNLYDWQNDGKSRLNIVLLLSGFIFFGLASIIGTEKKVPYYILEGIGMILILSPLALWIFS